MKTLLLPVLLLCATALLTGCGTDQPYTITATAAQGLSTPFTSNCVSITNTNGFLPLDTSHLTRSTTGSTPMKATFNCVNASGTVTGTTTLTISNRNLTASSSEGSNEVASYARLPGVTTSGVFPIIK